MKDRSEKLLFHLNKIRKVESQKEFRELSKKEVRMAFPTFKIEPQKKK
jgi:hypothetical protein